MRYREVEIGAVNVAMEKYRGSLEGEVGAALVVVGLSSEQVAKESEILGDMIRLAHRCGASIRQIAEVGLGRKAVSDIASSDQGSHEAGSSSSGGCPAPCFRGSVPAPAGKARLDRERTS